MNGPLDLDIKPILLVARLSLPQLDPAAEETPEDPILALTGKKSVFQIAAAIGKTKRPSVIWLHFQDCTRCTETLLRTSAPDVAYLGTTHACTART